MKIKESQLRKIIRESLEEISNQLAYSAISNAQNKKRTIQSNNMIKNTVSKINEKYAFTSKIDDDTCTFTINYTDNWKFFIFARYNEHYIAFKPFENYFKCFTHEYDFYQTPVAYFVDNLKAGERAKFKQLVDAVKTLNGENQPNIEQKPIEESSINSKYSQYTFQLADAVRKSNLEEFMQIFNSYTPEIKQIVYHYFADSARIKPEFINAMKQNI